ncbi:hypothetical protein AAX26_01671 [Aliarcobacter thereius]|uniref:Uncharacterized protein n=2 Tax=Aliarcobacter thereius TaxID=544718 RepID=A0A1C0B3Y1_9BACT|nr:hypothetical protein [Aliarcobacter thereius]OCL86020.1 hypothetical protein AAX26_01671 [Aliarcobacter thereius]OCL90502.1 hypothetical protein AAX25_01597 [Aliarcobacter thereius]OCL95703.1 hypothetical protein AA347_01181 [Aliarcobacter thereius LMG 24486]OCL96945.1 hypothetical protein AAX29_01985 [Aliarcobacter thereius]QBF16313.1 hypothetical protein ATH_1266 [Aliarcobacter thereius LMG 24486]
MINKLKKILDEGVLPELKAEIEALEKLLNKKKDSELEYELNYFKEVEKFYKEARKLILENKLSEKEAKNILLDLEDMEEDEEQL